MDLFISLYLCLWIVIPLHLSDRKHAKGNFLRHIWSWSPNFFLGVVCRLCDIKTGSHTCQSFNIRKLLILWGPETYCQPIQIDNSHCSLDAHVLKMLKWKSCFFWRLPSMSGQATLMPRWVATPPKKISQA